MLRYSKNHADEFLVDILQAASSESRGLARLQLADSLIFCEQELSPKLRKTTAVLSVPNANAPGGETAVYILAMSHVSQKSIADVRELIRTVQPEVVMVRLHSNMCQIRQHTVSVGGPGRAQAARASIC